MAKIKSTKNNREVYIPDFILYALLFCAFAGAWGAIAGLVFGACKDIYYLFTKIKIGPKDEGYW